MTRTPPVELGEVLLITGPMGVGKSSLAQQLARQRDWEDVSEDTFWAANGWSGLRSPEQETTVQRQVVDHVVNLCRSGRSAVLEFILYAEPPNPLSAYRHAFVDRHIRCRAVVLTASVAETMRRVERRARPGDLERLAERRSGVEHQLQVATSPSMRSYRIIDTSDLSVDEVSSLVGRS